MIFDNTLQFLRCLSRNRLALAGLLFLILIHLVAIVGPVITPYEPNQMNPLRKLEPPSLYHPLGLDEFGRDVLTRLIYAARVSLSVGLIAMTMAVIIGTGVGLVGGYYGRWVDAILMRITDTFMSLPVFFLAITILAVFGGGTISVIIAIVITAWMRVARMVRSEVLHYKEVDFVTAARSVGANDRRILTHHILPQVIPIIIVAATLQVAIAILVEAALSYLGLGIQPPTPTWGNLLMNAQEYLWLRPTLAVYPGVLILMTVLAYNFLGDGLRDVLDPHLRRRKGV